MTPPTPIPPDKVPAFVASRQALRRIRSKLRMLGRVERLSNGEGFHVQGRALDGTDATFTMFITSNGNLKTLFTKNLVESIKHPYGENKVQVEISDSASLGVWDKPEETTCYCTFDLSTNPGFFDHLVMLIEKLAEQFKAD